MEEAWTSPKNLCWNDKKKETTDCNIIVEKLRTGLEDSSFDDKATAEKKTHERRSDALKMTEMVAQVQEIISYDPCQFKRFITREKGARQACGA